MKVSIITATYNSAESIVACLDSVANQSALADIEHIVVDGISTDDTLHYVSGFTHIKHILSQRDRGIYHAFNKGVGLATGDIIYFLNSDDVLADNNVIEEVIAAFTNEAMYYSGNVLCQSPGTAYINAGFKGMASFNNICHQGFFCRREAFDLIGPFNECFDIAADSYFIKKLVRKYSGISSDRVIARFSLGGISSNAISRARKEEQLSIIDSLLLDSNEYEKKQYEKFGRLSENNELLKLLLQKSLSNEIDISRLQDKSIAIFGVKELSLIFYSLFSKAKLDTHCFLVSKICNKIENLSLPCISLEDSDIPHVDIVLNCIEGFHEETVCNNVKKIMPGVNVVSWRELCL